MDGQNFENENMVVNTTPEKKTDGLAIASLVLGILSIVLVCCNTYIAIVAGIVGIVLAIVMIILAVIGLAFLSQAGIDIGSLY